MCGRAATLVDLSETGALIRTSSVPAKDALTTFVLRWEGETIVLQGRVVRIAASPSWEATDSGLPATEHQAGVEFHGLPPQSASQLQRLVHGFREA